MPKEKKAEQLPPLAPVVDVGGASMLRITPNSKPKEKDSPLETYVYRDFANAEPSTLTGTDASHDPGKNPPTSLQSQKLPNKLNAMLSDTELANVITWMPHGRSWKILNREMFTSFALPRYFGHSNHASFVRIVNAWGFRRISVGVDRDSYYHELFLRGKPRLHQRMKRLPSAHRKTPVDKGDKCPDFYQLAETSPLPEVTWSNNTAANQALRGHYPVAGPPHMNPAMMAGVPFMPDSVKPIHFGDAAGAFASMGGMGGMAANGMAASNPMMSLLGMNTQLAGNASLAPGQPTDASALNEYTQSLRRENENLMLKIKLLEYENQKKQQASTGSDDQQASADVAKKEDASASTGEAAPAAGPVDNDDEAAAKA